ncbi:BTAD domain-containing putative transcriptional regulator [Streptomyces sp. NPDC007808]|uniref:AfsR/SARP family transcriptional regulator n=1 Tax=Streptomyces sp. NPDC007808 TaxID=3364779 RepID=UPI003682D470
MRQSDTAGHAARTPHFDNSASVHLLGSFQLQAGDTEVFLAEGPQRLVALLALRGRMTRSRLAGTLWPENTEKRALASLRTAIWRTNSAAPWLLNGSGKAIALDTSVAVDVRSLVETAKTAIRGEGESGLLAESFPDVDDDLLPDWDDEWLAQERERLRQLRLHGQEELAVRLADEGRYGLALELALAALRCDMLRESAHRSVIRIHLAEGNVSEAKSAYETCRRVLERELGVPPTADTRRLLTALSNSPYMRSRR